jgi:hypothetical protein
MKNKITAWLAIGTAFLCMWNVGNSLACALFLAFALAALLTPLRTFSLLRDNTIDAELNLNAFLAAAIDAFKAAVIPLTIFASTFNNVQLRGTDKVEVYYYPIDVTAAKDFNYDDGYVFDEDTNTAHREITVNKRKYVTLGLTSRDLARMPALNATKLGALKGENLAYQVVQDILSIVTNANYGSAIFTGAASTFDSDDVTDIGTTVSNLTTSSRPTPWPKTGRGLVVNPTYDGALKKDTSFKAAYAAGTNLVITEGRLLPRVLGFDYTDSAAIPGNGENLVGFAAYMSAALVAFSPIQPADDVMKMLTDYRIATDTATGISFEYRQWGDPDFDTSKRVIECNYGFAKGEANALKRLVSA